MGPWFHVSKQAHLIINSYIFQFHANKQANLNQLLPMYSNAMQTESPFESITSYVFQFHANNHARSINECLCITIPCKQTAPSKLITSYFIPVLCKQTGPSESLPPNVFKFHINKQAHLDWLLCMYYDSMQTTRPIWQ